jgi:hypothetical protein
MCERKYTIQEQKLIAKVKSSRKHDCVYCGKHISDKEVLTIDHIIPVTRGGLTVESNLDICCEECNKEKADMNKEEYLKYLELKKVLLEVSIIYKQFNDLYNNYRNIIDTYNKNLEEYKKLSQERRDLEKIIRDSKFNAAEGFMLCNDMRQIMQKIQQNGTFKSALDKSYNFAKANLNNVEQTRQSLILSIVKPIRVELGIGSLSEKQNGIIKELSEYILKYSKINKEIA